jgi:class 3 adenylate cyclase/CHASE2 domain-containing sensor protein
MKPARALASARSFAVGAFAAVVLAAGAFQATGWSALLNAKLLDAGFHVWRTLWPQPVARDVIVVGIDVDDLRLFSDPRDFWHPHYGRFLAGLARARPAVVGLDVVFPERSYQHLVPGLDQSLLKGLLEIRGRVPVVLARTVDDFNSFREIFPPYVSMVGAEAVGSVLVCKDEDEVIRRFDEFLCDEARTEPVASLAGLMAKRMGIDRPWRGWIDYRVGDAMQYVPFRHALHLSETDDPSWRAAIAGQPVLLGFILPFEDRRIAPVDLARWEPGNHSVPGVLVHAQVLRAMLNGGLIQALPLWPVLLLILGGAGFALMPSRPATLVAYALFLGGLALLGVLLLRAGLFLQVASPALAATLAIGARFSKDAVTQARERATLRGAFGSYVSPQIMSEILAGRIRPGLGGERRRVCILFSDIRDFTARSEHMQPEELIEMLNRYFTEMTQSVHDHGGTVDKFIGDGMMCFFGAPKPLPDIADAAFATARDMLGRLEGLNRSFAEQGLSPIAIGIGLHVGEAVVGHVGSDARHEYTVIGDAVNTASRIEGLTKSLGYSLVVSRDVWTELTDRAPLAPLGRHAVKGRSSVEVYGYTGGQLQPELGGNHESEIDRRTRLAG